MWLIPSIFLHIDTILSVHFWKHRFSLTSLYCLLCLSGAQHVQMSYRNPYEECSLFFCDKLPIFTSVVPLCLLMLLLSPLWVSWVQGYIFDMNLNTCIYPSFWKLFMFSFSFCPHFIHYVPQTHAALSAFWCWQWLFSLPDNKIAFCYVTPKGSKRLLGFLHQHFKLVHAIATEDYLLTCDMG